MFQKAINILWPKYIWLIPFVLISPAVFLIPNDVFVQYPWAKTYTEWLAQWIPMIDRASHLHPHPDKFRAFFAYAWSWLPVIFVMTWKVGFSQIKPAVKKILSSQPFQLLFITVVSIWTLWVIVYAPYQVFGGGDIRDLRDIRVRLYYSDWSLLWSGAGQVWGAVAVIAITLCVLVLIREEIYAVKTPGQES